MTRGGRPEHPARFQPAGSRAGRRSRPRRSRTRRASGWFAWAARRRFGRGATVGLGLASADRERHGKLAEVFAPGFTESTDRMLREILIAHSAGPALLRRAALDAAPGRTVARTVAPFTLLSTLSWAMMPGSVKPCAGAQRRRGLWAERSSGTEGPIALGSFTKGRRR